MGSREGPVGRGCKKGGYLVPRMQLCIDVDMSWVLPGLYFGVYRSPLHTAAAVLDLHRHIRAAAHVELVVVMGYEAQIAGLPDAMPGVLKQPMNFIVRLLKYACLSKIAARRGGIVCALKADGLEGTNTTTNDFFILTRSCAAFLKTPRQQHKI